MARTAIAYVSLLFLDVYCDFTVGDHSKQCSCLSQALWIASETLQVGIGAKNYSLPC